MLEIWHQWTHVVLPEKIHEIQCVKMLGTQREKMPEIRVQFEKVQRMQRVKADGIAPLEA
jgi:hypothetical protein